MREGKIEKESRRERGGIEKGGRREREREGGGGGERGKEGGIDINQTLHPAATVTSEHKISLKMDTITSGSERNERTIE